MSGIKSHRLAMAGFRIACLAIAFSSRADTSAPSQMPLDAFGKLPTLENLVISPDGKRLAFVRTSDEERAVYAVDLVKGGALAGAKVGTSKLRSVRWVDDDNLLVEVSQTSLPPMGFIGPRREWALMMIFDVNSKKIRPLDFRLDDHRDTLNTAMGGAQVRTIDQKTVLFVPGLLVGDQVLPALFSFTLPGLRAKLIDSSGTADADWLVDESGHVRGQIQLSR